MKNPVRLVFSERQQVFHYDDIESQFVIGGGYARIGIIDRDAATDFTEIIWSKYKKPTLKEVQDEFQKYLIYSR